MQSGQGPRTLDFNSPAPKVGFTATMWSNSANAIAFSVGKRKRCGSLRDELSVGAGGRGTAVKGDADGRGARTCSAQRGGARDHGQGRLRVVGRLQNRRQSADEHVLVNHKET